MTQLNQSQLDQFGRDGVLVVEDILEPHVLSAIHREYATLLDGLYDDWFASGQVTTPPGGLDFHGKLLESYRAGCDWFQPMDISLPGGEIYADTPMHFGPAVFNMVTSKRLLGVVEQLIGPEITSNPIQHVRIKPPADDLHSDETRPHISATDWHQDKGVAHEEADNTKMITVWLAISDATVENGCLQAVPKSTQWADGSKGDMLPHCAKVQTTIADGFVDKSKAVALPVKAGGAVIFDPLVPHSSLVNKTSGFRWSFDLRYNVTGQPTGRSHFPDFVAQSKADPGSELKDWREWLAMWEEARTRLAIAPHIPIHRWDADSPMCA